MKTSLIFRLLFLVVTAAFGAAIVQAEDRGAVAARMEKRIPAIDALKARQLVGENNRGYLEARGNVTSTDEQTISDENADRRAVYASIAAELKTSVDQVGQQRAQKIASNSVRGVWLQRYDGNWYQKP